MARRNTEPASLFIRDWLGGLNTRAYNTRVENNQYSDGVLNTRIFNDGLVGKRLGVDFYGTIGSLASSTYVDGLGSYYTSSFKRLLVGVGPYVGLYTGSLITPISGATFTINNSKDFITARGEVYIHNGADMLTKYDGNGLSRLTGAATSAASAGASVNAGGVIAKYGYYFKTSHLAIGNPVFPNRVFISQAANSGNFIIANVDGNSTDQAQWYDVAKDDGDELTGISSMGDSVILFKDRAIYEGQYNTNISSTSGAITSANNFFTSILPLNKGVGAASHKTIDHMENDIIFLSRNGPAVYVLGYQANLTGLRVAEISQPVRNILEGINREYISKSAGIYYNKKYYLSIPFGTSTVPNRTLVFNREYGRWEGVYQGITPGVFTSYIDPYDQSEEKLLMGDGSNLRLGEMESSSYTDFSSAINTDIYFKNFDLETPSLYKRWIDLTLFFQSTKASITVSVYIDNILKRTRTFSIGAPTASVGIGAGVIGSNVIGDAGGGSDSTQVTTTDRRLKINAKGRTCQVRVQNNTSGEVFNLVSMELTYRPSYGHGSYPSANKI